MLRIWAGFWLQSVVTEPFGTSKSAPSGICLEDKGGGDGWRGFLLAEAFFLFLTTRGRGRAAPRYGRTRGDHTHTARTFKRYHVGGTRVRHGEEA